ncbi:hypothetical protein [Eubacterium xylanophilum]|uniref:hypothetical protein n=1 Tax=Eubacterium xylanophilum TaxID=39497 RepID=UPI00047BD282|nr:hypothetical protein [Eubacterium xylanophilum]
MIWNTHGKAVRVYRSIVAAILVICLFASASIREYGPVVAQAVEESHTKYVSDIRLFYALFSIDEAKKKCKESGFIPVEGDLNNGTDKNHVVLGYKETDNREDAIYSVKLLSMDAGFELKDYKELLKEYKNTNAPVVDAIEAAALEFIANYNAGSPKAKEAYEGLNLICVPEADNMKLGDYIVQDKADWDFYADIVAKSSAGTINAILGYLSLGVAAFENERVNKKDVSVSWAEAVKDSPVWEEVEEAVSEDDFDDLYEEYGDDARAFHKKLQEFATAFDNAMATFDEEDYASELNSYKNKAEADVVNDSEKLSENDQGAMYIALYEELEKYYINKTDTLGEYLLELGHETSDEIDLTKLYPIIGSMTYAERCLASMGGLISLASTLGENKEDEEASEKISEAAAQIKSIIGRDSYSIWMNNNEEIKDKKVAYTSDAVRMSAAQKLVEDYDPTTWKEKADEVMKWVNLALGVVSCVLILAQFQAVATVIALVPAGICAIAAACGLTCAATTITAIATKIAGAAAASAGPVGWIALAVLVVSMIVIWAVSAILKYQKENSDIDYDEVPDYVADCASVSGHQYLSYYKGVGSERQPAKQYKGKLTSEEAENDYHGQDGISDVNGRMGFRGWNCMYYSKDSNTGSPLVIREEKCPFSVIYGDKGSNAINGYESVNSFGEITPGNCNALMKKDSGNGVFVHYRTEKSILNDGGSGDNNGNTDNNGKKTYIKDIIVKSADTESRAKAKISTKGYKVWDYNIAGEARKNYSRHEEWAYTYIGYSITDDPEKAIKDIRVATYTPMSNNELRFGDVKYGCAGNLGYKADSTSEDKEYPSDLDGLWITTDSKAGTPIEVGKLHLVGDHADGKYVNDGWVPVTTFSGVPYNFASTRDWDKDDWEPGRLGNYGYSYTCYQTSTDNKWDSPAKYLYYEPETKYTSGTKYLSGLFFTFGTDSESTGSKVGETLASYSQLTDRMAKTPNTVIIDGNLASSFYYKGYVVESNQKYMNLGYSWSYNPYRALTDIKAFQGNIFSTELPYSITKPVSVEDKYSESSVAYDAVTVISQRTTTRCKYVTRGIGPENAYMSPTGLLGTNKQVYKGYTSYKPGGYKYSKDNMPFILSGLYVSGPVGNMEKIKLNDIIISSKAHSGAIKDGKITANISGEKTLSGEKASGEFNSIQEMKRPHELNPFNIAYPEWTDDDGNHHNAATPLYIYTRRTTLKKKYISKLTVGSYSFDDTKLDEDIDVNHTIAKQVDLNAMVIANGEATDEVIPVNAAVVPGRAWYDTVYNPDNKCANLADMAGGAYYPEAIPKKNPPYDVKVNRLPCLPPHFDIVKDGKHDVGAGEASGDYVNRPATYISVSRTDNEDEAIRGILLFKAPKDTTTVAEKIQVDGVEYKCASPSTPIIMTPSDGKMDPKNQSYKWKKEKYYLYYTYNMGVSPGQPITDVIIDGNVFNSKQSTALCVDKKDKVEAGKDGKKTIVERAVPYGEGELSTFIHTKYEDGGNTFFNRIYTAGGSSRQDALLKLLEQGCTEFCDMNLNEGTSAEEDEPGEKKNGGDYIYFGYRGYTLDEKAINKKSTEEAREKELENQLEEAIYDIVCTVGEEYHPEGITTERYQIHYNPVVKLGRKDDKTGVDLNSGTNGPQIYMYYTTPYVVSEYNKKAGSDVRLDISPEPKEYLKSPLTRMCFTRYDRVPYSKGAGVASTFGNDKRPWEYVLLSDYSEPVDLNDGAVKLDEDWHTENNHISMFVQRQDGSVKGAAEITGGYISSEAEVGEMWVNN